MTSSLLEEITKRFMAGPSRVEGDDLAALYRADVGYLLSQLQTANATATGQPDDCPTSFCPGDPNHNGMGFVDSPPKEAVQPDVWTYPKGYGPGDPQHVIDAALRREAEQENPTGLCSAHRDGEDQGCKACYPTREVSTLEQRVIHAACGVVAADTYVHPVMSRADAVKAGVAELHDAVNAYHSAQSAKSERIEGGS